MPKETNQERQEFEAARRAAMLHAETKLQFPRMLRQPTVVVDLASEFWPVLQHSTVFPEATKQILDGTLVPLCAMGLGELTQDHAVWQRIMHESKTVPLIPTIVRHRSLKWWNQTKELTSQFPIATIPNLFVHKTSMNEEGVHMGHRGAGIQLVRADEDTLNNYLPKHDGEFLQAFILPPKDPDGKRYVRDYRVFIVGDKPVEVLVRRAKEPLSPANLRGEEVPRIDQIYSAREKGPKTKLPKELEPRLLESVHAVLGSMEDFLQTKRPLFSPHALFGFMSIDFLQDDSGMFVPVDCDVQPGVDKAYNIANDVAQHLAKFATKCANEIGEPKQVIVIGYPGEEFTHAVYTKTKRNLGEKRVIFQKSLMFP